MTVRAWKMNGKNLNYLDQDNSALDYALVNSGVIEWMAVTLNSVAIGRAILNTKRTSVTPNQQFGVHIEITAPETIDTSGTKKVWLALNTTYINDGTLATAPMGTQLASVVTGASYPADSSYYIPLASITGWVITDDRTFITSKPILRKWMLTAQNIWATNGSPNITVADTTGWVNGATITWTGIPGGTTISSFVANTSAILSANFTGTTWTVSATVGYKQLSEYDATGAEVKRPISAGGSVLSSDLFQKINPSTRAREEVTYASIKNDLSSAGSFIQSVEMGEAIGWTYSVTSFVPELTSDTSSPWFTVGYSGQYDAWSNAAWNAFNVNSAWWFIPNASPGLHWIKIVLPFPVVFNSFWVSKYDARWFDTGWKIQWSSDWSSWTDLYTAGSVMSTTYTNYTFSNTTPYAQYRLLGNFSGADSCGINRMNFDWYYTLSNPVPVSIIGKILYQNTLPSSAWSSKTRVGNRFMFPYAVRLRNFKTWQTTSTSSGTVLILDSLGNTLKTIALASGAQIADLDFVASANTEYRVVLNDSANWNSGSTYGTQTTALYQTTMPYALWSVSGAWAGTLDGANCVIFTECEVDYQNKWFRSKANTVKEVSFVNFSWFVTGSKSVWDIVDLNKTTWNLLDWFTWLTKWDVLYISNVAWAVSTTPWTIKNPIGLSVSATSAILGSVSTSINTLMSYSIANGGTGVTNYGEVWFIPGGQYSYTLVTTSWWAGAIMTLQWSYNGTDSWKDVISTTWANQTLTGSGSLPTGYIRWKQLSSAVSWASSITITG